MSSLNFCETTYSEGIEVFNTLTCLAYLLVGSIIVWREWSNWRFVIFGLLTIVIGFTSMLLHTLKTEWSLSIDLFTMIVLVMYVLIEFTLSLKLQTKLLVYTISMTMLFIALFLDYAMPLLFIFGIIGLAMIIREVCGGYRHTNPKILKKGLAVFVLAYAIWLLDYTMIICDANYPLINGHAIWHILTAYVIYLGYKSLNYPKI